ncbi:MAG TPA: sodium:solute symporter family protein [Streptosporangiaceae bacterium]|nr:sodium:solute symporter family protein [Streptosporangiaceae bacterium]
MNLPLIITAVIVGLAVVIGFVSHGRTTMDLEQWSVAGRRYGGVLLWVLAAGEIYTTFTFLGAAGYGYTKGGPAFYILGYGALAYIISFFLLPPLWRYAKRNGLLTQADYFTSRFASPWLGALAAVVGVVFVVPYGTLQLEGLGDIVTTVTNGKVSNATAMIVAFGLVALFVFVSGLRAAAWTSVLKDALLIVAVLIVGIGLPLKYYGSYSGLISAVNHAHPGHLALPGSSRVLGVPWMISTLVLTSMGFYMYPQAFMATYSARSVQAIRRNATFLPLYQILMLLMFYVGFTALLVVPGLKGANSNFALLDLVKKGEPAWITGLVGGAGALAAIVPGGAIVLAAATLVGRNIYRDVISPQASDLSVLRVSRVFVLVVMAASLYIAIRSPSLIVNLLLTAYDGVTQFFPAIALSLVWRRTSKTGVAAGLIVGVGLVLYLVISGHDPIWGLNAGLVALIANALVTVAGSLLVPGRASREVMAAYAPRPMEVAGVPAGTAQEGTAAP